MCQIALFRKFGDSQTANVLNVFMKPTLKIKNIGPIHEVEMEINKVNIFIGPQSSGKSTIAKIISFCQWLEKDILIHQGTSHIDSAYWVEKLHNYHKMHSYFRKDSSIEYHGNTVSFTYTPNGQFSITPVNLEQEKMRKITYIPSERNYVNIPNISSLSMSNDYIRDFIFDWLLIRNKYSKDTPQDIINLGVKYYYDKNAGDVVSLKDGTPISLNEASSGLQAIIPLLVSLSYSTSWIYNHTQDLSFDKFSVLHQTFIKELYKKDEFSDVILQDEKIRQMSAELFNNLQHVSSEADIPNGLKDAANLAKRLGKPHYTFMIIEEPEENLFPVTQYELVKHIFQSLNSNPDNSVVITTHSPYILTAVNNLIQAGNVIASDVEKTPQVHHALGVNTSLQYEDIHAWALEKGNLRSMNDDEFQLISAAAIDDASDIINKDFETLLEI